MSAPVLVDEKVLLDPECNADGPEQVVGEALQAGLLFSGVGSFTAVTWL